MTQTLISDTSFTKKISKTIKIVNVIVSGKLNSTINIEKLARTLPKTMYEPDVFAGLVYRRINPNSTIIMFSSGKITSIGTKSEEDGRKCIHATIFDIERNTDKKVEPKILETVNVVSVGDLNQKINLKKLSRLKQIEYNPEKFPGGIIILKTGKGLIFNSGKIVSVGCKNENESKKNIIRIHDLLKKFQCIIES